MFSSNTAAFSGPPIEMENEQTPMLAVAPALATTSATTGTTTALAAHRGKQHRNVRTWFGGVSVLAVLLVGAVWMQNSAMAPRTMAPRTMDPRTRAPRTMAPRTMAPRFPRAMAPQKDKQTPVAAAMTRSYEKEQEDSTERLLTFAQYTTAFDKTYATPAEAHRRQLIYEENLHKIETQNQDVHAKFQLGINQFTDMMGEETPKGLQKRLKQFSTATHDFTTDVLLRGGSLDEDANFVTTSLLRSNNNQHRTLRAAATSTVPNERDWRKGHTKQGAPLTTPVKDQGACGSCWAFAAMAVLESHVALEHDVLYEFSPQQLVDCAPNPSNCGGTGGCGGSTGELAYDFISKHGAVTEWSYGYTAGTGQGGHDAGSCLVHATNSYELSGEQAQRRWSSSSSSEDPDPTTPEDVPALLPSTGINTTMDTMTNGDRGYVRGAVAGVIGYAALPTNSYDALLHAVGTIGPVVISVAANTWSAYRGGVFDDTDRTDYYDINHAVVLEGYGTDEKTGEDYWLVRNSWGAAWGEDGYIRLKREDPAATSSSSKSLCKLDITPSDGVACTGPEQDIIPPTSLVCGTSGILYDSVIPVGSYLL